VNCAGPVDLVQIGCLGVCMRLRYEITRWDLLAAGMRSMFFERLMVWVALATLAGFWWFIFTRVERIEEAHTITSILFATVSTLCIAAAGLFGAFIVNATRACVRNGKGVLGEHTLEITEEGLVESTDVNRTLANWNSAFQIRRTGSYAFIYVSVGNAHVVPLKTLPLEGSVEEFLDELQSRIGLARQT
jgi:hypothetical protein